MKICIIIDRVIFPSHHNKESMLVTNDEYRLVYGQPPFACGNMHKNDQFRTDPHWIIPIPELSKGNIKVYDLNKLTAAQLEGLLKNCLVKPEPVKAIEWIEPTGYLTDYKVGTKVKFSNGSIAKVTEVPKFGTGVFHCTNGWCRFQNVIAIEKI